MKQNKQKLLSPETYIRTKARQLPIAECFLNQKWNEIGMAHILVARKHNNGNFTIGFYLVDTYALGVKDSFYKFNISPSEYDEIIQTLIKGHSEMNSDSIEKADYVLVHNIIYGAIAFAEDYGYKACREFYLTQFILEEDTEDIEFIDIDFGQDGKPLLIL